MKKSKLLLAFPKKKFLKLLSVTKCYPMSFEDRLVYSLLVYLSIRHLKLTMRQIARRLSLDKDTVRRSVSRLAAENVTASIARRRFSIFSKNLRNCSPNNRKRFMSSQSL